MNKTLYIFMDVSEHCGFLNCRVIHFFTIKTDIFFDLFTKQEIILRNVSNIIS